MHLFMKCFYIQSNTYGKYAISQIAFFIKPAIIGNVKVTKLKQHFGKSLHARV